MNTFGIKPAKPTHKLFEIDGFQLIVRTGPDEDGDGHGISYASPILLPSGCEIDAQAWAGVSNLPDEDEARAKVCDAVDKVLSEMDEEGARKGLTFLLQSVAEALGLKE